ncbi:MAG: hypothetical protein SFZ24_12065 [Planctomycetota bacterium]|nr:hypothetical protein [Planctomycetota bacterium]
MQTDTAIGHLTSAETLGHLNEALASWPGVQPADIERVVRWASGLRDDLAALIAEINDPDEVRMTLAINYIELKSRWIALNTRMNYQNFRSGSCDTLTALRGTAISALIARVEEMLTQDDIDQITQFLAEPVRRAA